MLVRVTVNTPRKEVLQDLFVLESFEIDIVHRSNIWDEGRKHCERHLDQSEAANQ